MAEQKIIPFTLGYEALRLLGKGMYSNLWAALSELIANGIDANASTVQIYIDMTDKKNSTIEILDNGAGMDKIDLQSKYAVIGQNRRDGSSRADTIMGRKGVGKLAALYLTNMYCIKTKTKNSTTSWSFDFDDKSEVNPSLKYIDNYDSIMSCFYDEQETGTLITLYNVNLSNIAGAAIDGLTHTMSNYFIYEKLPLAAVKFYVQNENNKVDFSKPILMKKEVAFKNMMGIASNERIVLEDTEYSLPLDFGESFETNRLIKKPIQINFEEIDESSGVYINNNDKKIAIKYSLQGWIGIHSSILQKEAQINDKNFIKNAYYSPNKLRLYIRNKLAVENFLPYLHNTQQGINYIEGEISFDLLDENNMEDITTSNRQDVDVHDDRVVLLIKIVTKIVNKLITIRNNASNEVADINKKRRMILQGRAKEQASQSIKKNLEALGVEKDKILTGTQFIESNFKGNISMEAKEEYKVFISHSSKDKRFSDFLYYLLLKKGADKKDIFYTTAGIKAGSDLQTNIIENISAINVLVVFLDTANSLSSQYCLFEGGAYWATRSVQECWHLHLGTNWIPDYLYDSNRYHVPLNGGDELDLSVFELSQRKYIEVTSLINEIINHLNKSSIHNMKKIRNIDVPIFDMPDVIKEKSKQVKDYIDEDFRCCWEFYIENGETDLDDDGKKITKQKYVQKYNEKIANNKQNND